MLWRDGQANTMKQLRVGLIFTICQPLRKTISIPALPERPVDVIYLCSPNNPTGTVLTKDQLQVWVDYANQHEALIMFDAAYERFITEEGIPHSIYEVEGAQTCAIEFRSFSKTAGFTGARCGYTVVPKALFATGKA